jgi:hypothetical protein
MFGSSKISSLSEESSNSAFSSYGSDSSAYSSGSSDSSSNPWGIVTIRYSWSGSSDLDTATTFNAETVGWSIADLTPYMTWSGDDTSDDGYEDVVIDLAQAWLDGVITDTAVIQLAADWYPPAGGSGPANVEFSGDINPEGGPSVFVISPGGTTPASTSVGTLTIFSDNLGFTFP